VNLNTATAKGLRPQVWSGKMMFDTLVEAGRDITVWMSYGHVNGVEQFNKKRMHANVEAGRVEALKSDGTVLQAWVLEPAAWQAKDMRVLVR
jgi:hypothetical protein